MYKINVLVFLLLLSILSCKEEEERLDFEGLIPINGTELYVKAIGEGDPLVIIHGGPGLGFGYFLPQLEELKREYRLIFFDQRISGRSSFEVSPDSISLEFFVSDIEAIRQHFELNQINVLAHSWGNFLAIEYALNYPYQVNKVILSNSVPLSKEFDAELQSLQVSAIDSLFMAKRTELVSSESFTNRELQAYEDLFKLSFSLSFYDQQNLPELNFKLFEGFFERNTKMQYFKGLEEYDYYPELKNIKSPTLVIRGVHDLAIRESDIKLTDSLPNAELVEMRFSGHFPFVEQTEEYLWEVRNFLKN